MANEPKTPKQVQEDNANLGKKVKDKKQSFFWSFQNASQRRKQFWVDIETTGLGREITEFGPTRFKKIVDELSSRTTLANKIEYFKRLDEYKYFEQVGLAQVVTSAKQPGKALANIGLAPLPHGSGYTTWVDGKDLLKTKNIQLSKFAQGRGIIRRTMDAYKRGDAATVGRRVEEFANFVTTISKSGRQTLSGWNVHFDVFGMSHYMVKHAATMLAAGQQPGFDPFAVFTQVGKKNLVIEGAEDYYFDLIRYKGWRDKAWANKHIRYGKMFAAMANQRLRPGETPVRAGDAINIEEDIARRAEGRSSLLRGRFSWKAERLEEIYNRFGGLGNYLQKWGYPSSINIGALEVHDALYDVPLEAELQKRFKIAGQTVKRLDPEYAGRLSKLFPGLQHGDLLAFGHARAGFLGKGLSMRRTPLNEWIDRIANSTKMQDTIFTRHREIMALEENFIQPKNVPAGPYEVIYSKGQSYKRRLWSRDLREVYSGLKEGDVKRVDAALTEASLAAKKSWASFTSHKKLLGAGAVVGAFALYNAIFRQQDTVDANLPSNYIPGQQGTKVIPVPWSSPYMGPDLDDQSAIGMMAKGAIGAGAGFGIYNLPAMFTERGRAKLYYGAAFFEDITPFRLGRLFNLTGAWSSYLPTGSTKLGRDAYNVTASSLMQGAGLNQMGRAYARATGLTDAQLAQVLIDQGGLRFVRSKGAFMRGKFGAHGSMDIRFFEGTSRLGKASAIHGAPVADVSREFAGDFAQRRIYHNLYAKAETGVGQFFKNIGRSLYERSNTFRGMANRYASISLWEDSPFEAYQRQVGDLSDVLVPGYRSGAAGMRRASSVLAHEFLSSGYSIMRRFSAALGIRTPAATSIRNMGKGALKAGAIIWGTQMALSGANEMLGGALTAPFYNIYERTMLARAKLSELTGLTSIRKRFPDIQGTAPLAIGFTALTGYAALKFAQRLGPLAKHYRSGVEFGAGPGRLWQTLRHEAGDIGTPADNSLRTSIYKESSGGARAMLRRWFKTEAGGLNFRGKIAAGAFAIAGIMTLPFILGSKETEAELRDIYAGRTKVPIKRGRWWEFGATPYEGGRTAYFRMHQLARRKADAGEEVVGEGQGLWAGIKTIFDPYWRERESYHDRPYPISSAPGGTIPFIGPLVAGTIGKWFKRPVKMHTDQWEAGQDYEQYGGKFAPNYELGGLPSPQPLDPYGLAGQIKQGFYRLTEFAGLRGFMTQSLIGKGLFGTSIPGEQTAFLEASELGQTPSESFWEAELGGMMGLNEAFRRFYPRPEDDIRVNPLRNTMPSWMPGNNYFINFKEGDPYNKIPYGEERLPGPGYEELNPDVAGMQYEDYPAFHKYKILADIAPWATQTRQAQAQAYIEARNSGDGVTLGQLDEIDYQRQIVQKKRDFKGYGFTEDTETIHGTISRIGNDGTFGLSEYPSHTFSFAALRMGISSSAAQIRRSNSMTKEAAMERAYALQSGRKQELTQMLAGKNVALTVQQGALMMPTVEASVNGGKLNRKLANMGYGEDLGGAPTAGFFGSIYGGMLERLGHLPQKVPGPWFAFTKFFNQADDIEEYQRTQLYGTETRFWDEPYKSFIRPYVYQTIAKMTPGEFVPRHVEKRREIDTLFDRAQFLKYYESGDTMGAMRTMAGANVYGPQMMLEQALPHRDKSFFQSFVKETDPSRRKRILSMVSQDMQRALAGQWQAGYMQAQGAGRPSVKTDMNAAARMAAQQIKRMGYKVPGKDWIGYNQSVDFEDVKAVMIQHEGLDRHDFNIWDDRTNSLLRKPYLHGADEGLTSRRMPFTTAEMGSRLAAAYQTEHIASEGVSHEPSIRLDISNNVNYSNWYSKTYENEYERMLGY